MYYSDFQAGSLVASVFEVQWRLVHPKNIVQDEPDRPLAPPRHHHLSPTGRAPDAPFGHEMS
jgi:hypothetical protein